MTLRLSPKFNQAAVLRGIQTSSRHYKPNRPSLLASKNLDSNVQIVRGYAKKSKGSTDPKKCRTQSLCKKFNLCNCEQAKQIKCDPWQWKPCTKKEAPYPSFSETCAEELSFKPSECRICFYNETNHPTFKFPLDRSGLKKKKNKK